MSSHLTGRSERAQITSHPSPSSATPDLGPPIWRNLIAVCLRWRAGLTPWEAGFVDSLAAYRGRTITARQFDILLRIMRRVGAGGGS